MSEATAKIQAAMDALGLTVAATFVPFSKSRNAKPKKDGKVWKSLNWRVTIKRNDRAIMETDYSAGEAHAPAYKKTAAQIERAAKQYGATVERTRRDMIAYEIENGRAAKWAGFGRSISGGGDTILPDAASVIMSLVMDASVLDAGGFEDWAAEYGYDTDSREAESTYRACLEIALKLRGAIGEAGIEALRVAGEDF